MAMAPPDAAPRFPMLKIPPQEVTQVLRVWIAPTTGPSTLAMAAGCEAHRKGSVRRVVKSRQMVDGGRVGMGRHGDSG
eukprot:1926340-Rhodomonas_salina.5